ncbi:MAG TPA: hypothetical protein VF717_01955 [Pyrinomonadaceae bacterium]
MGAGGSPLSAEEAELEAPRAGKVLVKVNDALLIDLHSNPKSKMV